MNLHEYQAKDLLRKYGLPVPANTVCSTSSEVEKAFEEFNGSPVVVKCQAYTGGRGKVGGVKVCRTAAEAREFADRWLGQRIVTVQTGERGQPVSRMLVEACSDISRELYLGATIDRSKARVVFMASTEGGMEIEKVAAETPEKIFKVVIDPISGAQPFQGRELAFRLGLSGDAFKQFVVMFLGMSRMFHEQDLSLLEINPLVVTGDNQLLCLDAKINIDSNALFRHKDLAAMDDPSQQDPREARAQSVNLNYVALDGNIGCMVNGAGLAMGTMDIIKTYGGNPANFLDVGGTATKERVVEAFKIILSDKNVKCILVNIFGGIVRCDLIAEGIVGAVEEVGVNVPVVVRLEGNQAPAGLAKLDASGLNIISANSLREAAELAVKSAR
jgi:succinyl-CoA synthetase beta subunit